MLKKPINRIQKQRSIIRIRIRLLKIVSESYMTSSDFLSDHSVNFK